MVEVGTQLQYRGDRTLSAILTYGMTASKLADAPSPQAFVRQFTFLVSAYIEICQRGRYHRGTAENPFSDHLITS